MSAKKFVLFYSIWILLKKEDWALLKKKKNHRNFNYILKYDQYPILLEYCKFLALPRFFEKYNFQIFGNFFLFTQQNALKVAKYGKQYVRRTYCKYLALENRAHKLESFWTEKLDDLFSIRCIRKKILAQSLEEQVFL